MMFPLVLLLILIVVATHQQFLHGEEVATDEDSFVGCVKAIHERYFHQPQNIEIITQRHVDKVIKSFGKSALVIRDKLNLQHPDFRQTITKYALIFLERPNYMENVKMLSSLEKFDPQGRYIISVNNEVDISSLDEYISKIIGYLASIERWNVVILMSDLENGGTRVFSYTLYSFGNCRRIPKLIDHGDCENAINFVNLFPDFVNLHKCPLRLVTISTAPYSIMYMRNGLKCTHGIESNVVNLIVNKFNGTPEVSEEHRGIDMREKIRNRTGDLAWGTMLQYVIPGTVYSRSYLFMRAVVVIPQSRMMTPWMNLVLPFNGEVWMTLGLQIASCLAVTVLVPFVRKEFTVEYLLAGFTGIGVRRLPKKLPQRIYYMSWLIVGYIVTQTYLAYLTGILTSPAVGAEIQTLEELSKRRISVAGPKVMRELYKESNPGIYRDWKVQSDTEYFENIVKLRTRKGGVTTYTSEYDIPNITYGRKISFHVIPEHLNTFPLALLMANSSQFHEGSNRIIEYTMESGHFNLWKTQYTVLEKRNTVTLEDGNTVNSSLSLRDLKPVFLMMCVGHAINSLVFILELIKVKSRV